MYEKADRFVPLSFLKGVGGQEDTHPVLPGAQQVMEGPGSPWVSEGGGQLFLVLYEFWSVLSSQMLQMAPEKLQTASPRHRDHLIDTGFSAKTRNSFLFSLC